MLDSPSNNFPPAPLTEVEQAAVVALQEILNQPSRDWALQGLHQVRKRIFSGEPVEPWIRALLSLRDSRLINGPESVYLMGDLWEKSVDGRGQKDPEISAMRGKLAALNDRLARDPTDVSVSAEKETLFQRWTDRGDELFAQHLLSLGERMVGEVLAEAPDAFLQVILTGHDTFWARWPETTPPDPLPRLLRVIK